MKSWRVMDLFSGIGAFGLGLERAGMRVVSHCEIDAFCRRVLDKHWPGIPCHDDVTTREFTEGEADVICGGFPCQDLSYAGKRAGLSETRSGLYRELVRAIRVVRPRVALLENVADLLRGPPEQPGEWFHEVLGDLAESGACVEWDCVSAATVGAPHERSRVWIVAHADRERCGETWGFRHRPEQMPSWGTETGTAPRNAPNAQGQQVGIAGQPRRYERMESGLAANVADANRLNGWPRTAWKDRAEVGDGPSKCGIANPSSLGCGQGRPRRPPDSFARIRDEARRNAADPYGARLAFREGLTRNAWEKLSPAERSRFGNERQSVWPDEPALQGMDDVDPYWMDRVKATGNAVVPLIPQLIGEAIMAADEAAA